MCSCDGAPENGLILDRHTPMTNVEVVVVAVDVVVDHGVEVAQKAGESLLVFLILFLLLTIGLSLGWSLAQPDEVGDLDVEDGSGDGFCLFRSFISG